MQNINLNNNFVINETEINAISDVLEGFLADRLGYSKKRNHFLIRISGNKKNYGTAYFQGRSSIGEPNDLYIRFGHYAFGHPDSKYIVVARIGFRSRHKGHGTALLKELCSFGEKFGYEYLEIESPNKDCQTFMKKLGFKDRFYLPIHELKKSIREYEARKLS